MLALKDVKLRSSSIGEFDLPISSAIRGKDIAGSALPDVVVSVDVLLLLYSSRMRCKTRRIMFPTANSIGCALIIRAAISRINWMREAAVDQRLLLMTVRSRFAVSMAVRLEPVICLK